MKKILITLVVLTPFYFISCNQSDSNKKSNTSGVHEVVDHEAGNELTACYHASKIYWQGTKPTGEHNGLVKLKEGGSFVVEDNKLVGGEFIIDMSTIVNIDLEDEGMNAKLVKHLKSEDFFYVDSFPEAKFVIAEVGNIDDKEFNVKIKGNLTVKGISQVIAFKANVKIDNGIIKAVSDNIVIDRTKFGVNYKSKSIFKELKDKFIDDEFTINMELYSM